MFKNIACLLTLSSIFTCLAATGAPDTVDLEQGFLHPPDSAKPWTWWHWMNGCVSKEGITADLESMQRVGLGGAIMFNVDQ